MSLEVHGIRFVSSYRPDSSSESFFICKEPNAIRDLVELLGGFQGANILELGIWGGGSTALIALLAAPRKLVAIDLADERVSGLDRLIHEQALDAVVRPYYGVDQSDRHRLAAIVDAEFGDQPLDLVIDDASHLPAETRTSFEVLFPRLRPGGLYLIEDWNWQQRVRSFVMDPEEWTAYLEAAIEDTPLLRDLVEERIRVALLDPSSRDYERFSRRMEQIAAGEPQDPITSREIHESLGLDDRYREAPPLMAFITELVLAQAEAPLTGAAFDHVGLQSSWTAVRRGPAELDPATFRLHDLYHDLDGILAAMPTRLAG